MKGRIRLGAGVLTFLMAGLWVAAQSAQIKDFRPITDQQLRNPDPGDWVNWRRTLDGWGYSPLNQINRQNVGQLQLAWSWAMQPGSNQPTPIVYNGIMFLPNPSSIVQALDAATGDLIWEYRREFPGARDQTQPGGDGVGRPQRSLAIWDDKIYINTADAHIVALDARTGKIVWDTTVADASKGYGYTSGPLIVNGKVVSGMTGCSIDPLR